MKQPDDKRDEQRARAKALTERLEAAFGVMLTSEDLQSVFRFESKAAVARSIRLGHFPCLVFSLPGRAGKFALASDVAECLASRGASIPLLTTQPEKKRR